MKTDRIARVNEILKRELATQMYRLVRAEGFDPARVTVTRVKTAVDLRTARVYVSVMGGVAEKEAALSALRRSRAEFQAAIRDNVPIRYTPHLHFTLDESIEKGSAVLEILSALEAESPTAESGEEPPAGE